MKGDCFFQNERNCLVDDMHDTRPFHKNLIANRAKKDNNNGNSLLADDETMTLNIDSFETLEIENRSSKNDSKHFGNIDAYDKENEIGLISASYDNKNINNNNGVTYDNFNSNINDNGDNDDADVDVDVDVDVEDNNINTNNGNSMYRNFGYDYLDKIINEATLAQFTQAKKHDKNNQQEWKHGIMKNQKIYKIYEN